MGRDQHIIDELARIERTCLELADGSTMPEERAGLRSLENSYRAEIEDRERGNRFTDTKLLRKFGVSA
ncbi:hypothetical protein [Bradyrhizobium iriomotense]|uniref:Uncharacterized protein n=1 Tax=Bradyrhizobium iriomotense TaxID=441950 RepID=A0ABQ6B2G0_9BRAD|nr:hypothetical protein [Bradyrhizobium iriomotense]GLR87993.1 hypothetical protein GCM10007857_47050 [Bradyrhizobium iriomotense]